MFVRLTILVRLMPWRVTIVQRLAHNISGKGGIC